MIKKDRFLVSVLFFVVIFAIVFSFYFNLQVRSGKLFRSKSTGKPLTVDEVPLSIATNSPLITSDIKNLTSTGDIKEVVDIQLQVEDLVIITNFNIAPSVLTVKRNSKVTWINNSDKPVWLTSLKDSKSIISECNSNIFDSCKEIKPKEKWSFIFSKTGEWEYYDRLHPYLKGKVIVK